MPKKASGAGRSLREKAEKIGLEKTEEETRRQADFLKRWVAEERFTLAPPLEPLPQPERRRQPPE